MSEEAVPEGNGLVVATIAAKNYLARVRVLAASLRAYHPEVPFVLLLTDEPGGYFDPAAEAYPVLLSSELGRPELESMAGRTCKERAAAAKPFLLEHLLASGYSSALFLDPDTLVLGDLQPVFDAVQAHAAVLTPHLTAPPEGADRIEREQTCLQAGTYNAGFIGVSERPEARRFLRWWQARVRTHCRFDLSAGLYYDQRWLDLAAVYFDDLHVLRDPGVNVGHWNLIERKLIVGPRGATAEGAPLRLMHFSGFDPAAPERVSSHSDRLRMNDVGSAAELFRDYAERLEAAGQRETRAWPYALGQGNDKSIEVERPPGKAARRCEPLPLPRTLAAATIAAKRHLSLARVLAASFRAQHPEVPFFVLLADEPEGCFIPDAEPFRVVRLEELDIPDLAGMRFRYTQQELTYAATPFLLRWLLDQGFAHAAFLKQESLVLGDLSPVLGMLEHHAILLTPHLLSPLDGADGTGREATILQSGVYNVGFLGVSEAPEARRFLGWWQDRLRRHCRHDVPHGMHFEQRWLDLVPLFFDGVGIVRDRGFNVGHWNLPERRVEVEGDTVTVDAEPARFVRLSGFEPEHPEAITRYSPRLSLENAGDAGVLWRRYVELLDAAGYRETSRWPYAYERFDNGARVTPDARALFEELGDGVGDPLHALPAGSLYRRLVARRRREAPRRWWQGLRDRFPVRTTLRRWFGGQRKG